VNDLFVLWFPYENSCIVRKRLLVYAAMELIITPERLSREELTHELSARGTKVTDADGVDKLVHNLKYYLALESSGFCLKRAQDWTPSTK
jgi:hypothetical protein